MNVLRGLAERISRGRVIRRRLPSRLGGARLYVSPDAALRYWLPGLERFDPLLLRWAEEHVRRGMTVWDVGANVGLFTFAAAHVAGAGGRLLAIEPDAWLAGLIERSAGEAPATSARVEALSAAVADQEGVASFAVSRRGLAGSHLTSTSGSTQTGGSRETRSVPTVTLDGLLQRFGTPGLVKVDVEGAELACLRGAEKLLSTSRPTLLCEVGAEAADEVGGILYRHGYRLFDASSPARERAEIVRPTWNTLAVPETRSNQKPP